MTPDEIKKRLASYKPLRFEVERKEDRHARMRSDEELPAMREADGSKHTGGKGDRMERAILRRMEWEEKNLPQIREAKAEMVAIEAMIDELEDPLERECLRLRYIDGDEVKPTPWKAVALSMLGNDEERHLRAVTRYHFNAISHLTQLQQEESQC